MEIDPNILEAYLAYCKLIQAHIKDPSFAQYYRQIVDAERAAPDRRKRGRPKGPALTEKMVDLALTNQHLSSRKYAALLVSDPKHLNAKREEIKRARQALIGIENHLGDIAEMQEQRFARKWRIHPEVAGRALDISGKPRAYEDLLGLIEEQIEDCEQRLREIGASKVAP
jgi:hypothetical protein